MSVDIAVPELAVTKVITSITVKKDRKPYPRKNAEPQYNHGTSNPRQLRNKTQTVNKVHSTRKRIRAKTRTNTKNTSTTKARALRRQKIQTKA